MLILRSLKVMDMDERKYFHKYPNIYLYAYDLQIYT